MEQVSRLRFFKAVFLQPWVGVLSLAYTALGLVDTFDGWIVPRLSVPYQEAWKSAAIALPSLTWQTWVTIGILLLAVVLFEGAYRLVRDTKSQSNATTQELRRLLGEAAKAHPRVVTALRWEQTKLLMDVQNNGAAADFWAEVSATGTINTMQRLRGAWVGKHAAGPYIPNGDRATIQVAELEILAGVTTQDGGTLYSWNIFYYAGPQMAYPTQTQRSHAFGPPGVVDSNIDIEVVIASKPDMLGGIVTKRLRVEGREISELL